MRLNSEDNYEPIEVRLSKEKTPIAWENRVQCLILSGYPRKRAEKLADVPIELELYYEIGAGLFAVDTEAVDAGTIYSPYTKALYHDWEEE